MKEIDATRLKLKAMELVEGAELEWFNVIRFKDDGTSYLFTAELAFSCSLDSYELALGIIEGKPVWAGDTPYFDGKKTVIYQYYLYEFNKDWSWLPPKPRTAMVELLVEDIKALAEFNGTRWYDNLAEACRKTLEGLK